jgi:hypothetical protein
MNVDDLGLQVDLGRLRAEDGLSVTRTTRSPRVVVSNLEEIFCNPLGTRRTASVQSLSSTNDFYLVDC